MEDSEFLVAVTAAAIAAAYWLPWLRHALAYPAPANTRCVRIWIIASLAGCMAAVLATLLTVADPAVRDDPGYIFLFLSSAAAALAAVTAAGALIGVSAVEDGVRRANRAALWLVCGQWMGAACCICGANVGRGDSIWTTLGPMVLALACFTGLWALFAGIAGAAFGVAVQRDCSAAMRLAALLIAWGLILGRSVAGDWSSTTETLRDFGRGGWIAVTLLILAIGAESLIAAPRQRRRDLAVSGMLPALVYLGVGVVWVILSGHP